MSAIIICRRFIVIFFFAIFLEMCLRVGFDTEKRLLHRGVYFGLRGVYFFWSVSILGMERGLTTSFFALICRRILRFLD